MTAAESAAHGAHAHSDPVTNRFGMWLFLLTEVLLFGVLFIAFSWFYMRYSLDYHESARELNRLIGAVNTFVLLTSSLTVALGLRAFRLGRVRLCTLYLAATIGFALLFLVIKAFEWSHKFEVGLYINSAYLLDQPKGVIVFFGLYFLMTGLHALHVLVGAAAIGVAAIQAEKGRARPGESVLVENVSLYWHLVDVIWIYLFPLFYLIGR